MAEKKDFMSELARQVDAKKKGEVEKINTVDDYVPKKRKVIREEEPVEPVRPVQPEPAPAEAPAQKPQPVVEPEPEEVPETPKAKPVFIMPAKQEEPAEDADEEYDDEEEEEYDGPASFAEEKLVRVDKPKRQLKPAGIALLALLAAALLFGIWWIFIAAHIPMPDFVGQPVSTVSTWAKQNQMESGVVAMAPAEYSMEYDKDIVIRQSVNPGRKVKTNTPITITVSNGPDPDEEIEFPNIYFMTQQEIQEWKNENKLLKFKLTTQYSSTVPSGEVISYEVKNGSEDMFTRGTTLNVICSKGPAPASQVTVDDFRGKSYAEVETWARNKKILLEKRETNSATVAAGNVISTDHQAGTTMTEGETLIVIVSKGKGVTLPNFVGYTAEQMDAWQAGKGNNVTIIYTEKYDWALQGTIIGQDIPAGTLVDEGAVVMLTRSLYMPLLETNSREWLGQDYLQLKKWVDDVNGKDRSVNIQAGEYIGAAECSNDYPTPGQIIDYACFYGTSDLAAGCGRPLNAYSRIGYKISTGACSAAPAQKKQAVFSTSDVASLSAVKSFCETNGLSCTYTESNSGKDVKATINGQTHETGDSFTQMVMEGDKMTVVYNSTPATPEPTPTPEVTPSAEPEPETAPKKILMTGTDIQNLAAINKFCNDNAMSCTYADNPASDPVIVVKVNGNTHKTGESFSELVEEGASIEVSYE